MSKEKKGWRLLRTKLAALRQQDASKTATARSCGMSVEQLRHIEAGRRSPTLTQAFAIEAVFPGIPAKSWV